MIRTVLITWAVASVPCSVLLGRTCRATSAPLPGWRPDGVATPALAHAAR